MKAGESKPDMKPVAERLVFRKPGEALNLGYSVKGASGPGSAAELDITATDEKGNPVAAVLYATAVNSGVARGEKDRLLTTHFLIAGEVTTPDGLEHAEREDELGLVVRPELVEDPDPPRPGLRLREHRDVRPLDRARPDHAGAGSRAVRRGARPGRDQRSAREEDGRRRPHSSHPPDAHRSRSQIVFSLLNVAPPE